MSELRCRFHVSPLNTRNRVLGGVLCTGWSTGKEHFWEVLAHWRALKSIGYLHVCLCWAQQKWLKLCVMYIITGIRRKCRYRETISVAAAMWAYATITLATCCKRSWQTFSAILDLPTSDSRGLSWGIKLISTVLTTCNYTTTQNML